MLYDILYCSACGGKYSLEMYIQENMISWLGGSSILSAYPLCIIEL